MMGVGDAMDDGLSTLGETPGLPTRLYGPVGRRGMARQHRRRRVLAGLGFMLVVFVAGRTLLAGTPARTIHHRVGTGPAYPHKIAVVAGSGPGSLAGVLGRAENRAIDRTLAVTPFVRVAGAQHREIALTFDDGPGPYTPAILRILRRSHVPATFFEVGVLERYFHASTQAIVSAGDVIGDHTEAHAAMTRLSAHDQQRQLLEDASVLGRYGAAFPRLFRPPYGMFNAATLAQLRRYRMLMVLWTVDSNDYRRPGVKAIVRSALSGARSGAIILLHDAGGNRDQTVVALPKIIAALRARGFTLVTVPRLLLDNPPSARQNVGALPVGAG